MIRLQDKNKKIYELESIINRLKKIMTEEEVYIWLKTNNKYLENQKPINLIVQGKYVILSEHVNTLNK